MLTPHEFLFPDYYPNFQCKIGACRHTCCVGWPISISLQDYYNLLGVSCSQELRRKLDSSLRIVEHPTNEYYAQICPGYDGDCGLRHKDGRCLLHAELGPQALAAVCRLYPRGVRAGIRPECSCANSCEAVLESFLHRQAPIAFSCRQMTEEIPPHQERQYHFVPEQSEQPIRLHLIRMLQNRNISMPRRLMAIGAALGQFQEILTSQSPERAVEFLLQQSVDQSCPADSEVTSDHLLRGLNVVENMVDEMDRRSPSVHDCGMSALSWFKDSDRPIERYRLARQRFYAHVPQWEIFFEHVFVNHMFFAQFPFQDRPVDLKDEHVGLCAGYAFLRFLCLGYLADHFSEENLIDVCALAFRLVEHTSFDVFSARLLRQMGCASPDDLWNLICL